MEQVNHFIGNIRPILEALYFIASICLVATIFIGLRQLNLLKQDLITKNKRAAVEKSIEYLHFFASQFLPSINSYKTQLAEEVSQAVDTKHLYNDQFLINMDILSKEELAECLVKEQLGLTNIFHELEFFSTAILNGVADEELIYKPIGKVFCDFIEEEHLLLSVLRNSGAPYINLIGLFNKWEKRKQVEEALIQKQMAELKISQIGDGYKSHPPIGM